MRGSSFMTRLFNISIFLVLFVSLCDSSSSTSSEQGAVSYHTTSENSSQDQTLSQSKDDLTRKLLWKHSSPRNAVARKGVTLREEENTNSTSALSSNSPSKNQSIPNDTRKNDGPEIIPKNLSKIANETNSSSESGSALINGTSNKTNTSSTAKPVMKPLYTSDDYSSADYDQTNTLYASDSNSFLTAFSLSIFIVFLIVMIVVLFFKLKYKFSVHQNYRRVDYLIDGMYL